MTRIYLLERTPLKYIKQLNPPPKTGDIIAFFRPGQDSTGEECGFLREQGFLVIATDRLLTKADCWAIHHQAEKFTNGWYRDLDGTDMSLYGAASIGRLVDYEILTRISPSMVYRIGEICRRLIHEYHEVVEVLSDITDGKGLFCVPDGLPIGAAARAAAEQSNRSFTYIEPIEPLPYSSPVFGSIHTTSTVFRQFVGGLRPRYLLGRIKIYFRNRFGFTKPSLFIFPFRFSDTLVDRLLKYSRRQVITAGQTNTRAAVLRPDHLFALPTPKAFQLRSALLLRLRRISDALPNPDGQFSFRGIDYGPILATATLNKLRRNIFSYFIIIAQTLRAEKIANIAAVVLNGFGLPSARFITLNNIHSNLPIYHCDHGYDICRPLTFASGGNYPNVVFLSAGEDYKTQWGNHLCGESKPQVEDLGNLVIQTVEPIRGRRSNIHQKRVLFLDFVIATTHGPHWRAHYIDRYMLDIFSCAQQLVEDNWTIGYRIHPGWETQLERHFLNELGLTNIIHFDRSPTISDALLEYDVIVGNFSAAFCQALYAGWPAIFHEPNYFPGDTTEFVDEFHLGLMAANDIERPISRDVDSLYKLVKSSLDPESQVSKFPTLFNTRYKRRFLGENPQQADKLIADFIIQDLDSRLSRGDENSPSPNGEQFKH